MSSGRTPASSPNPIGCPPLRRITASSSRALHDAVKAGFSETYPEPVSHCDICRWWKECDGQGAGDDHLSFVAGASRLQRKELILQGMS